MSKEMKAFDIRGFFGGPKQTTTVVVGKPAKKPKEEKTDTAQAATEAGGSPARASSGSAGKRPRGAADVHTHTHTHTHTREEGTHTREQAVGQPTTGDAAGRARAGPESSGAPAGSGKAAGTTPARSKPAAESGGSGSAGRKRAKPARAGSHGREGDASGNDEEYTEAGGVAGAAKGAAPSRRQTPPRAAAAAANAALQASAIRGESADDDDGEDEIVTAGRRGARTAAAGSAKPRVAKAVVVADEEDSDEDIRISEVKRSTTSAPHDTTSAKPASSSTAPPARVAAPAPAPAPAAVAVDPALFFGGGAVTRKPAPSAAPHAASVLLVSDDEDDAAISARRVAAAMKASLPIPEAPTVAAKLRPTAVISVSDSSDDDVNLLAKARQPRAGTTPPRAAAPVRPAAAAAPAPVPAKAKDTPQKRPRLDEAAAPSAPKPSAPSVPSSKPASTPSKPPPTAAPLQPIMPGFILPKGAPDCLAGTKWCATGELTTMTRDQVVDIIKRHGGDFVQGMSGMVTHLLIGDKLEDGRPVEQGSKYQKAMQIQEAAAAAPPPEPGSKKKSKPVVKLVREPEFISMLEDTLPPEQRPDRSALPVPGAATGAIMPATVAMPSVRPRAVQVGASAPQAGAASADVSSSRAAEQLWVEKYRPVEFSDFVGNTKELNALDSWLREWHDVHIAGTREKPKARDNPGARAALISGPPGIGKTTTAIMLGKRHGFDVLEMNASDTRSKNKLQGELEGVTDNLVLNFGHTAAAASAEGSVARRLIIMDEVDGMSSGDRGGNAELIKIIKSTRTPIICICNDRQKPTVRSLANHCYDIKFATPGVDAIVRRLQQIALAEGMEVEDAALAQLVESCGRDLRACINTLQMWASTSKHITASGMKDRLSAINKDAYLRLDAFSATPRLFNEARGALDHRLDLFYVDYDLIPLLVHQAYPHTADKASGGDLVKLQRLSKAADAISDGDVYSDYIRGRQAWGLLPSLAVATVRAATLTAAPPPFMTFPTYLAKNSSRTKRARLLAELGLRIAPHVSGGREAIRLEYFSALRDTMFAPLTASSATSDPIAAADRTIRMMDEYGLSREDVMETMMTEVSFEDPAAGFPALSKMIDPKVKAAFTREYNKLPHRAQSLGVISAAVVASMRGGKRGAAAAPRVSEEGEEVEDDEEGEAGDLGDGGENEEGDATAAAAKPAAASRGRGRGRGGATATSRAKPKPSASAAAGAAAASSGRGRGRGRGGAAASAGSKRIRAAVELSDDDESEEEPEYSGSDDDDAGKRKWRF